jgi:hypothetical protein
MEAGMSFTTQYLTLGRDEQKRKKSIFQEKGKR